LATQMSSDNRRLRGQAFPARSGAGTSKNVGELLVSPFVVDMRPAPPVNARTASPLPCSFAATLPRAPIQAPLPDSGISSTRPTWRAPGITPAARALPRLEPVFTQSVTSLDLETLHSSLPCEAFASLYVRGFRRRHRFARKPQAISGYESRSSPYPSAKVFLSQFGTSPIGFTRKRFPASCS
jgi:hypothetical protein